MRRVKVTRSFQVTIPVEVREKLGISVGDELVVWVEGGRIVMEKVESRLPTFRLGRRLDVEDIEGAILKGFFKSLSGGSC